MDGNKVKPQISREKIREKINNLRGADKYLNRELSWLQFNIRVLEEARNSNHPLLERLRFLSISGNNLDEFYMVRVAGLKGQSYMDVSVRSDDGLSPAEQLVRINETTDKLMVHQQEIWAELIKEMRENGIILLNPKEITPEEFSWVENYFLESVLPVLTPIAVDPAHPFPFIQNQGFTMVLSLTRNTDNHDMVALLPVPHQVQRFIRLPKSDTSEVRFIAIERILEMFLNQLFPGYTINGTGVFRVIRDSDMEIEEEAEDLVRVFESALKRRRKGRVIRLKMNVDMPERLRNLVISRMDADEESVILVDGILGINETSQLIVDDFPDLIFTPYNARFPERVRDFGGDIFKAIKSKDFVVHHPYESFDVVHQFLVQAANDPDVVAIKQTLYRAGSQSQIIRALIEAAENGKSVTAVVELKARFDEAQNIKWARDLERAGVHVVYGVINLKTHAKVSMVVRREEGQLHTYMHFGTGNYHPITAKVYTDLSFFTDDKALSRDANRMFNYLTGYVEPIGVEKLSLSPFNLRSHLIDLIEREIQYAREGKPAAIWVKLNSLLDPEIIDKLYEASQNGVQIDLVVRGICTLRPGIKGLSSNIRVRSIVGRFLEHARICCFGNGSGLPSTSAQIFISSADWMPRNFDRRVETLVPIENQTVHNQIMGQVMAANLMDNQQTWTMDCDGNYSRVTLTEGIAPFSAHHYFMTNPSMSGMGTALKGEEVSPIYDHGKTVIE
ncbi:polyphosphate kinase [Kordiimonas sediminis]|uniref:Polyphosphate kinase n=1 Tax=Kordiimonas sediminis TaxID=1735581 RepID=A0A919E9P4_9PROT|nr:RNA degradosome polyphosphate kinase [Kordiimonas sediminis]GHF27721.1 polyphosphate kinase [Kordiimonas sediminis]